MPEQKNTIVIFTPEAESVFSYILEKYTLVEDEDLASQKISRGNFTNMVLLKKMIRAFAQEIITQKDFLDSLSKVFGMDQQKASDIFGEIKSKLVPQLDKVQEDKLEEYNLRGDKRNVRQTQDKPTPTPPPPPQKMPYGKKIEITNVEENAKKMAEEENKLTKAKTVIAPQVNQRPQSGEPDVYREPLE